MPATPLRERKAWQALERHYAEISGTHLRDLFAADPGRGERLTAEAVGIYLDYSKNRITDETLALLIELAEESGVAERRDAMFRGEHINVSENRAVLHTALRLPATATLVVDGQDVVADVHAVLARMRDFANRVRSGEFKGYTGKPIKNVINVGIGGSDLGPVMAYEALKHYCTRDITFRFVSNVDSTDFVGGGPRPQRRRDPFHHFLQDVRDAGDPDQRQVGAGLGGVRPRLAGRGGEPLRRGVHQRRAGVGVRDRHGEHVRVLGLGRRAVLDGLRHRAVHDDRARARPVRRDARRVPRHGRALPHRAAGRRTCRC